MISLSDNRKFADNQNFQATLYNKMLFPQMWKHCPISVCRTPPGGPLCPHLAPLMRPEEERCSSLIVHSIKRWNGKIPSRLLYLDKKKYFFCWQKNSSTLLSCTHHMVLRIPNYNFQSTQFFLTNVYKKPNKLTNKASSNCLEKSWKLGIQESGFRIRESMWWDWSYVW